MRSSRLTRWMSCALRFSTVSSNCLRERPRRSRRVTQRLSPRGHGRSIAPAQGARTSGDHVDENTDGAGLPQPVFLGGVILVCGRHAGIAEDIAAADCLGRLLTLDSGTLLKVSMILPFKASNLVSLFVSIL